MAASTNRARPEEGPGGPAEEREELAALTRGLAAAAERASRRGVRRLRDPRAHPEPAARAENGARSDAAGASPAGDVDGPARSPADVRAQAAASRTLDELRARVARCKACALHETRTQTVFADGEGSAGLMFIGEAPGAEEDRQGVPFVGRAGQLLTDIVQKGMGLQRREVTIANVLKCRPPENRDPTVEEKRTCTPWLDRQVELVDPRVLIPLGRHAAMHVLGIDAPMGRMRGRVHEQGPRKVVPTFHPAYLLRSPQMKKECWADIQLAMGVLGIAPPAPAPRREADRPRSASAGDEGAP